MPQTIKRNCPYCGKEFDSWNGIKDYCSEDCKREMNRERKREYNKKQWRKNHPR